MKTLKQHAIKINSKDKLYPFRYEIIESIRILVSPLGIEVEGEGRVMKFDYKHEVEHDYVIIARKEE